MLYKWLLNCQRLLLYQIIIIWLNEVKDDMAFGKLVNVHVQRFSKLAENQSLYFIGKKWLFLKQIVSIELWEDFVLEIHSRDLADLSSFVVMRNHYSLQTH